MVRISVSLSRDEYNFLQFNCISASKLLQKEIDRLILKDLNSVKCEPFVDLKLNPEEVLNNENH